MYQQIKLLKYRNIPSNPEGVTWSVEPNLKTWAELFTPEKIIGLANSTQVAF